MIARRRATLRRQSAQLAAPDGGEQVAHPVVEADLRVLVVRRRLARLRRQVAGPLDERGIVGHEHAAAARGDDLVAVEREDARSRRSAPAARPRYVAPERLGRVLDRPARRSARARLEDRVPVGALAVEVDGDRRGRQASRPRPARASSSATSAGSRFQVARVAVDEHRPRADVAHRVGGGDEGERRARAPRRPDRRRAAAARGAARRCRSTARPPRPPRRSSANSRSNASTCGPSGAIQLESNASSSSARSAAPTSGGDRKRRVTGARYQRSTHTHVTPVAWSVMKVVVTGGAGFIGANLCRALVAAGHDVVALDDLSTGNQANLDGVDAALVEGSILDPAALDDAMRERPAVVHLAARPSVPRSRRRPDGDATVANATGTLEVLEAARRGGEPARDRGVVVVGLRREPDAAQARGPRHASAQPLRARASWRPRRTRSRTSTRSGCPCWRSGSSTCSARCNRPAHAYAAVVPAFVDAALDGRPLVVHGDGRQSRDFTYVDTVAEVIADAVARTRHVTRLR